MKTRLFIIAIIIAVAVGLIFFRDRVESAIGSDFSFSMSSSMEQEISVSVIRFQSKAVSIVPICGNTKIQHFQDADEEKLKSIMGIENFYQHQNTIQDYKRPRVPSYIPKKGDFTHRVEKTTISLK